jgi:hypothetical protein
MFTNLDKYTVNRKAVVSLILFRDYIESIEKNLDDLLARAQTGEQKSKIEKNKEKVLDLRHHLENFTAMQEDNMEFFECIMSGDTEWLERIRKKYEHCKND